MNFSYCRPEFIPAPLGTLAALLVLFGTALTGCPGEEDTGDRAEYIEIEPEESDPSCEGASLASSSAEPLQRLEVEPDLEHYDPAFLVADVEFDGISDGEMELPVYRRAEDGSFFLSVPPHPAGIDGGDITLAFSDDTVDCEDTLSLTIEPLDPAPGTLEEMIEHSSALNETIADAYGYDADELVNSDLEDLPVMMIPIALQNWMLDHPDNPDSLLSLLEDDDLPIDGYTDEDLEFAEALLAASGHVDNLEQRRQAVADFAANTDLDVRFQQGGMNQLQDIEQRTQPICSAFDDWVEVEIEDHQELSDYMIMAQNADSHGERIEAVGTLVGVLSMVPGPSQLAGALVDIALTIDELLTTKHSHVLPRQLADGELEGATTAFFEDYQARGNWDTFRFEAHSPGWDATADIIDSLISLLLAANSLADEGGKLVSEGLIDYLEGYAGEIAEEYIESIADNILDFLDQASLELFNQKVMGDSGLCVFEPGPWGPFEITSSHSQWFDQQARGSIAMSYGPDRGDFCAGDPIGAEDSNYEPERTGDGELMVGASGTYYPPGYNTQLSGVFAPVEVLEIEVEAERDRIFAVPGEEIELKGEVRNAIDRSASWETPDSATIVNTTSDDGEHTATLQLTNDEEKFPILVYLVSESDDGLRSPSCDPDKRYAWFSITNEEGIDIFPNHDCLPEGGSMQFDAHVASRQDDPEVQWSASSGTIDDNGHFTADGRQDATITATVAGTDLEDEAKVRVGRCGCYFTISAPGAGVYHSDFGLVTGNQTPDGSSASAYLGYAGDEGDNAASVSWEEDGEASANVAVTGVHPDLKVGAAEGEVQVQSGDESGYKGVYFSGEGPVDGLFSERKTSVSIHFQGPVPRGTEMIGTDMFCE